MSDLKIIRNTDDEVEIEITQPNDLIGGTEWWTDDDWLKWNEKMKKLEQEGTKGELETINVILKKNPFIDGNFYSGTTERSNKNVDNTADERGTKQISNTNITNE